MTAAADVWDAIIVGAGPAGSSLAHRLGSVGKSVLLLDGARFPRDKLCGEYLGAGSIPLLEEIGALRQILPGAHAGRVVAVHSPNGAHFTARYPDGQHSLSLPRRLLDAVLLECARSRESVQIREGFRVQKLLMKDGAVCGVVGGEPGGRPESYRGRITVGADGRNSVVARHLGLFRWHSSHRKSALGRHYSGIQSAGEDAEIYIGRSSYGILNHQALGSANLSIVADYAGLMKWRGNLDAWFDALLADLGPLRERLGFARPLERVRALGPLAHRARQVTVDGALLAGDAAGFYDPFTGEGVYMALESARLAAGAIHTALERRDFSRNSLRRYAESRTASLRARYGLEALIQQIVGCPWLANFAAGQLRTKVIFANRLLEVIGGLRQPSGLFVTARARNQVFTGNSQDENLLPSRGP